MVSAMESTGFDNYMAQEDAGPSMARDERQHARTLSTMYSPGGEGDIAGIARSEKWHRVDTGGSLRAAIFGISDGLLSNLSLVIGVAGANPDGSFIVLAGVAGLLAGAFSMGAGEYISVTSQRELFERQIALEKEELEADPEQERQELALIYRAKGLPKDEAEALSGAHHRESGRRAGDAGARGTGAESGGPGLAVGGCDQLVRRVCRRRDHPRDPVVLRGYDAVPRLRRSCWDWPGCSRWERRCRCSPAATRCTRECGRC